MRTAKHLEQDFELNLAPIIDCFTVLITYLLVSAAFLALGALDVGVATTSESAQLPDANTPPNLVIELGDSQNIYMKLVGGSQNLDWSHSIPSASGKWDVDSSISKIATIQKDFPKVKELSLTAHPSVSYDDVVTFIERVQIFVPKVFLAQ